MSAQPLPLPLALAAVLSFLAFAWATGFPPAANALLGAACLAAAVRGRLAIPRSAIILAALLLGLLIFANLPSPPLDSTLLLSTGYGVGLFLGALLLPLMARRNSEGETFTTLFLAMTLMLVAGSTTALHPFAEILAVQSLLLSLGLRALTPTATAVRGDAADAARIRPTLWSSAALIVALGLASLLARGLYASERAFNRVLLLADPRPYAYPQRASLHELMNARGNERVIARVSSASPPMYLTARCYQTYERNGWDATRPDRSAPRAATGTAIPGYDGPLFRVEQLGTPIAPIRDDPVGTMRIDRIETAIDLQDTLFITRDTRLLGAQIETLERDPDGICYLPAEKTYNGEYVLARDGQAVDRSAPSPPLRAACLKLPRNVDGYIPAMAARITGDAASPLQAAQAIERHLQTHYRYGRGTPLPAADPLRGFLVEGIPAHCELFATSMALMLRASGIPSRYVTGCLVQERNAAGDYWVVREETAHAWVEAWIAGTGWIAFDPTPPDGRPHASPRSRTLEWLDVALRSLSRLRGTLLHFNLREMLAGLLRGLQRLGTWLMESPWRLLALVALFVIDALRRARWQGLRWPGRRPAAGDPARGGDDARVARLCATLTQFDALAQRKGCVRPPACTLREFSLALRQDARLPDAWRARAADFLDGYSTARYGTSVPAEPQLHALETLCAALASTDDAPASQGEARHGEG